MKTLFTAILGTAVLIAFVGVANAATNLVVNGGFESPVISPPYFLFANPTGWTGQGDLVVQGYAGSVHSGDGNQWLDLNPGTGAGTGMSQDITLTAGTKYQFSFLYNGGGGGSTTQISYSLGSSLSSNVSTASMNVYGGTPWATYSTGFTPTVSGAETLNFVPNGVLSGGFIDAVNISPAVPVPEPETYAMLLAGLGLLGFTAWRRKDLSV
jgi:Carbohydrate binding domain/PEP-CTERM motif